MNEQWKELKETIIELRDNDGTGTQQEVCKFLANLMDVLEKGESLINDDAVSRQAVLDHIYGINGLEGFELSNVFEKHYADFIKSLPSVTPQSKMGHWIQTNEFFINQDGQFIYKFICSECKSLSYFRKSNKKAIGANVCPNCGAKMQEIEE